MTLERVGLAALINIRFLKYLTLRPSVLPSTLASFQCDYPSLFHSLSLSLLHSLSVCLIKLLLVSSLSPTFVRLSRPSRHPVTLPPVLFYLPPPPTPSASPPSTFLRKLDTPFVFLNWNPVYVRMPLSRFLSFPILFCAPSFSSPSFTFSFFATATQYQAFAIAITITITTTASIATFVVVREKPNPYLFAELIQAFFTPSPLLLAISLLFRVSRVERFVFFLPFSDPRVCPTHARGPRLSILREGVATSTRGCGGWGWKERTGPGGGATIHRNFKEIGGHSMHTIVLPNPTTPPPFPEGMKRETNGGGKMKHICKVEISRVCKWK